MKIVVDKIESPPPHALTVRDVKRILAAAPEAWREGIVKVRLFNTLEPTEPAFFSRYDGALTISSRGRTPRAAVTAILSELATVFLGLATRCRHRLSAAERDRIEQLVEPLVEKLLPEIIRPEKQPLGYHPSIAFRPVSLTEESPRDP